MEMAESEDRSLWDGGALNALNLQCPAIGDFKLTRFGLVWVWHFGDDDHIGVAQAAAGEVVYLAVERFKP